MTALSFVGFSWLFLHGCKVAAAAAAITPCVQSQMKWKGEVTVPVIKEGKAFPEIFRRLTEILLARELCPRPPKLAGRLGKFFAGHSDAPNQIGDL